MDSLTLLDQARAAGLEVRLDGDRLVIRGPKSAASLAEQLLRAKEEVMALLTPLDDEVAWRVDFMRPQVSASRPIPFLVARRNLSDAPAVCLSCDGPLSKGRRYRCDTCVQAVEQVLIEIGRWTRGVGARLLTGERE